MITRSLTQTHAIWLMWWNASKLHHHRCILCMHFSHLHSAVLTDRATSQSYSRSIDIDFKYPAQRLKVAFFLSFFCHFKQAEIFMADRVHVSRGSSWLRERERRSNFMWKSAEKKTKEGSQLFYFGSKSMSRRARHKTFFFALQIQLLLGLIIARHT